MKPFLFPFTYVSMPDLASLGQFFKGIKVFQFSRGHIPPEMQTIIDTDRVESVMPDPPTQLAFETALAETENWARIHRLGAASYARGYQDKIPFFDASSVTQIRQDIRKTEQRAHPSDSDDNETLTAYIFLHMAQSFDMQNQSIVQQMRHQASMEKTLYEELRGDASLEHMNFKDDFEDPAQYMLLDRLTAWSRVWASTNNSQDLFITTRQAVIALIQEHFPENQDLIQVASIPVIDAESDAADEQYRHLWAFCHKLASFDLAAIDASGLLDMYVPSTAASDGMQIYLLPGIMPQQLFGYFAEQSSSPETGTLNGTDVINTVIGLLEAPSRQNNIGVN